MSHLPTVAGNAGLAMLTNPDTFAHVQRVAKMYAESELIPPHMRGKVADVCIAFTMAQEMGENPVVVMQNMYVVSGRAGWSSAYVIAKANRSGIFRGRINWRVEGKGESLTVTCFAKLADTGDEVSYTVSMAMANAEGWTKNPKYKTMPELMLRYRSGAALVRLYAWEVMLGYATFEELETLPAAPERIVVTPAPRQLSGAATVVNSILDGDDEPERVAVPATPPHVATLTAAGIKWEDACDFWSAAHGSDPDGWSDEDKARFAADLVADPSEFKKFMASTGGGK